MTELDEPQGGSDGQALIARLFERLGSGIAGSSADRRLIERLRERLASVPEQPADVGNDSDSQPGDHRDRRSS